MTNSEMVTVYRQGLPLDMGEATDAELARWYKSAVELGDKGAQRRVEAEWECRGITSRSALRIGYPKT